LSVASATYFEIVSDALKGTSSDFGQLVVQRHFSSGIDCAMAGAATAVDAASPAPAVFRNSRRFMMFPPFGFCFEIADSSAIWRGAAHRRSRFSLPSAFPGSTRESR
jgi:hypothetical protein